ncbi:hypothetical protein [Roseibium aggregatum]|uniref:hypothetical protein n=1 Tax=Roseibium aggregatum TaxID=187304 RepID=UPI0012F487D2|nr:hypothetical protein [Roseibium aggregatum]
MKHILPFVGLLVLAGCGESPESHLVDLFKKRIARKTLIPNEITINSKRCDGGMTLKGRTFYRCSISFSETDISGITRSGNANLDLVKDSKGWYLAGN